MWLCFYPSDTSTQDLDLEVSYIRKYGRVLDTHSVVQVAAEHGLGPEAEAASLPGRVFLGTASGR